MSASELSSSEMPAGNPIVDNISFEPVDMPDADYPTGEMYDLANKEMANYPTDVIDAREAPGTYKTTGQDDVKNTDQISGSGSVVVPRRRIRSRELFITTRQWATLLKAGMPLATALTALAEQLDQQPLAEIIHDIRQQVSNGMALSQALGRYPGVFGRLYISMVEVGQSSGTLEEVLFRLADMLEKKAQLSAKLKAALAYPAVMTFSAIIAVTFLMIFVVPGISQIYAQMNRQLPWPTTALITLSSFLRQWWFVGALAILATIALTRNILKKDKKRKLKWDRMLLKIPVWGTLLIKLETARLTRTLSVLLAGGVPILQSLRISRGIVQNSYIAQKLEQVSQGIGRGRTITQAMKEIRLFDPILTHTVATGEMSGNLETQLENIADIYDEEIRLLLHSLTSLIEPIVLLFMGTIIGFIVLAMLLPIFQINQIL